MAKGLDERVVPDSVPALRQGAVSSEVGEDFVVLDAAGRRLRGLNATAARVWQLIDGRRTVRQIACDVERHWSLGDGHALSDVTQFLEALRERELINVAR